jgi:DNA-directed RNA polymerase subunit RPC12/RpoP
MTLVMSIRANDERCSRCGTPFVFGYYWRFQTVRFRQRCEYHAIQCRYCGKLELERLRRTAA